MNGCPSHLITSHHIKCDHTSCHISERDAKQAICKKGTEVMDCPDRATCRGGSIIDCEVPLEIKMDGSACVLTAEAEEEVDAVVQALR